MAVFPRDCKFLLVIPMTCFETLRSQGYTYGQIHSKANNNVSKPCTTVPIGKLNELISNALAEWHFLGLNEDAFG
jgi:hypothetical protein